MHHSIWALLPMVILASVVGGCGPKKVHTCPIPPQENDLFTLESDLGLDSNCAPLNPRWLGQNPSLNPVDRLDPICLCGDFPRGNPQGKPVCTDDLTTEDTGRIFCNGRRGHINWFPATFSGWIRGTTYHKDGDYSWDLETPSGRILTTERQFLHAESRGRESLDCFDTEWWSEFRNDMPDGRNGKVNGRFAVISGLLNLDAVHFSYTELHPIYALGILTERKCDEETKIRKDTWQVFLRNAGDQGFCSDCIHFLQGLAAVECDSDKTNAACSFFGIDLPLGQTDSVTLLGTSTLRARPGVSIPRAYRTDAGATIGFAFPSPSNQPIPQVHGEIHLEWKPSVRPGVSCQESLAITQPAVDFELEGGSMETMLELLESEAEPGMMRALEDLEAQRIGWCNYYGEYEDLDIETTVAPLRSFGCETDRRPYATCGRSVEDETRALDPRFSALHEGQMEVYCNGVHRIASAPDTKARIESAGMTKKEFKGLKSDCRELGLLP